MNMIKETCKASERRYEKIMELLLMISMVVMVFFICYGDRLISVYFDDLGTWELADNNSPVSFIMNTAANKLRPVSNLVMYIFFIACGKRPDVLGYLLLLLHGLMTVYIYCLAKKMSGSYVVAIGGAILYAVSRFSYYHVSQYLGIMETCGLFFAITFLYCGYGIVNKTDSKKRKRWIYFFLCYFLATFSHERYLFLFPVMIYVAITSIKVNWRKKIWQALLSICAFLSAIIIRSVYLGNRAWDGTGGTDILDTFSFGQAIRYAISQVLYLLGWNDGPSYLCGLEMMDYSGTLIVRAILVVCGFIALVGLSIYLAQKNRNTLMLFIKNIGLFAIFIAMCIGSSSTTIRVEMRWIYTSYAAMILFVSSLWAIIKETKIQLKAIGICIMIVFMSASMSLDYQLRSAWDGMYYQTYKVPADSLYRETFENYGDDLENKQIILFSLLGDEEVVSNMRREISAYSPVINFFDNSIDVYNDFQDTALDSYGENVIYLVYVQDTFKDVTDFFDLMEENV